MSNSHSPGLDPWQSNRTVGDPQTKNQSPVLPEEGVKAHSPVNNPYVNPPVC